jgi:mRNA-degrading endonuclease toxin of MazEF toxin-antitoxin module
MNPHNRGAVVKGPDLLGEHSYRPYICLSDDSPPFRDEEAVYTPLTTTSRSVAIPISDDDFISGGLPKQSYVNPWNLVTIRHADMLDTEGQLTETTVNTIARRASSYLGVE